MDLHLPNAQPTPEERAAVAAVVGEESPLGWGLADVRARRHELLEVLHELQRRVGHISAGALAEIARRLGVPPAEAYGVASFYHLFRLKPGPPRIVHVCQDISCQMAGAGNLLQEGRKVAGTRASCVAGPCLGLCDQAPAIMVSQSGASPFERACGKADVDTVVRAVLDENPPEAGPANVAATPGHRRLLRRVGVVDPMSESAYAASGGWRALARALEIGPQGVIAEVTASRLMGRGGAAFPTGRKWAAVAAQSARPHWLVCNADESEPGTFKDRVILEGDPFALVEAMTIAGVATGCERGILYLRGEYPLAHERMANAIMAARTSGKLGANVLGSGVAFDLEIRRGAGAYICGEETALFASIEGYRGEPRSKPPFPVERGVFGKPTVINTVETLVNVLDIVTDGGAAYASIGTAASTGTRLFCVSGAVARPGLVEVPFGVRLADVVDLAGGLREGATLQAILLGGAAGTMVGPEALDWPVTFEGMRERGATLGSGVVVLIDDAADGMALLRRIAAFFRDESCGQCVPCRVGTVRQEELLTRAATGRAWADDGERLQQLDQVMRDASICGLGQTASSVVMSAKNRFPHWWGAS